MCACCRYTRRRFECKHGGVLNMSTEGEIERRLNQTNHSATKKGHRSTNHRTKKEHSICQSSLCLDLVSFLLLNRITVAKLVMERWKLNPQEKTGNRKCRGDARWATATRQRALQHLEPLEPCKCMCACEKVACEGVSVYTHPSVTVDRCQL